MNAKWAWGIIGTLLVTWIIAISGQVFALSQQSAATEEILPRIEAKVNEIAEILRKP